MATSDYRSSADLKAVLRDGIINEDVMQSVIDVMDTDGELTTRIGSDSVDNSYTSWTQHTYQAPDVENRAVDGEDATTYNESNSARVGNHCQISRKVIGVTTRSRNSDVIGTSDEFNRELVRMTEQLRRDVEAIALTNQNSLPDDGNTQAGQAGGLRAWLTTNTSLGATTGANGGYNTATGVVDSATAGDLRAVSETAIRNIAAGIHKNGFKPSVIMCRPDVRQRISEYMFTDTARIGIQQTETGKGGQSVAVGAVHLFITDFCDLEIVSNLWQPTMNSAAADDNDSVYILTPDMLQFGYLHGYRAEPLAKLGLADRSQVAVDWTLKVLAEQAQGVVADVDATLAMVG